MSVLFRCACGAPAVTTPADWEALPLVGYLCTETVVLDGRTYPEEHLEMRNCACGTTKAIVVPHGHPCKLHTQRRRHHD